MDAIGGSRACRDEAGGLGRASLTVRMPLAVGRRPAPETVVTLCVNASSVIRTRADPTLLEALARAYRWQRLLNEGRYASISELAAAERIERGYLGTILRLTLSAPDIVEAIVNGRQQKGLSLPVVMDGVPELWASKKDDRAVPGR